MSTLLPSNRERLAKLLALFGSNHAGERDAAGLAAHRLLQARGLTWQDVFQPRSRSAARRAAQPEQARNRTRQQWQELADECLHHPDALEQWEVSFLRDIMDRGGSVDKIQKHSTRDRRPRARIDGRMRDTPPPLLTDFVALPRWVAWRYEKRGDDFTDAEVGALSA